MAVLARWVVVAASVTLAVAGSAGGGARPSSPQPGPRIKAPAAIVIDAGTGAVLYAKRQHMRRPIASTTKIMTAVVAMEHLRPNAVVRVPRQATRVADYREGLKAGERVPVWKLYYGLLLASGNDTAVALAVAAGGTRVRFLRLMNEKAGALGLRHTRFRSASGLIDKGNSSTAQDLASLARYAMRNARFRAVVATKRKRVWWRPPAKEKLYENRNKLLGRYPGADGIKTGWTTEAGHCLVASARRYGIRLITVVLDSPDMYGDTKRLLAYGFGRRG